MSDIKPIETVYQGYRFRSRLEARWAVFFDTLGVEYRYEENGFDLDGVWYLPDFWLTQQECWIEIKGKRPREEEQQKAELLAYFTRKPVCILWGDCWIPKRASTIHHNEGDMFWYEKSSATFYGPHIPFPFDNRIPYDKHSKDEKRIIYEWEKQTIHHVEDVPLPIVKLLRPYRFMEITLNDHSNKIEVQDARDDRTDYAAIASLLEKHGELLEFLSIRKGWRCVFDTGCYLAVGWGQCSSCGKVELSPAMGACNCECDPSLHPKKTYDSPTLVAAYTAARQARFEHGEKGV